MKKKAFWKIALAVVAVISFTACTNDECSPLEGIEEALPEGKYPLEIASATLSVEGGEAQPWGAKAAQTRVTESTDGNSSTWETGDVFYAKPDGAAEPGTFRIEEDGTVSTQTTTYWTKATENVTAWYPANGTISLADQSDKLAYLLQATATNASCNSPVSLSFTHKLAKVRVVFTGGNTTKVEDVKIEGYTSCTNNKGTIENPADVGEITMCKTSYNDTECWEANVVPGYKITKIKVNGSTEWTTLNEPFVTPKTGELCTITIGVNPIAVTGGEITEPGDYIVTGSVTETITLNGEGINLTLKDASISVSSGSGIAITDGSPTIRVEGTNNTVKSSDGAGIYVAEGSTVNITGDSRSDKLTVTGGKSGSGIGACNQACGNIAISNITVNARGTYTDANFSEGKGYSAGIGGSGSHACGTITIDNATVNAYGMTDYNWVGNQVTPGIGGGLAGVTKGAYGAITIRNSTVYTYRGSDRCDYIGSAGATGFSASSLDGIDCNGGGSTGSTVYCYTQTSKDASTLDKTIEYDTNGTSTEQYKRVLIS